MVTNHQYPQVSMQASVLCNQEHMHTDSPLVNNPEYLFILYCMAYHEVPVESACMWEHII